MDNEKIRTILREFQIQGTITEIQPVVQGHINDTYRVCCRNGETEAVYALQEINRYVFKQPALVMENICAVTAFLHNKLNSAGRDARRGTLTVVPTVAGGSFYIDDTGEYWRVYDYIIGASTYDTVQNSQHLTNAGYAFGEFQTLLADFPIETLHDTIPDFHNTKKRLADFFAMAEADPYGRAKNIGADIEFFRARAADGNKLIDMRDSGALPLRVTHNDTKYNNIMIDDVTGEALCVIDLDTVMPGLSAYDFGDAIRFAASTAAEDETDLSKVGIDMALYEQFTSGFVRATAGFLTDTELAVFPWGARIITLELASRFLLDYLNNDQYFKIHRPGHNLERARCQMALVRDMERRFSQMEAICEKYRTR